MTQRKHNRWVVLGVFEELEKAPAYVKPDPDTL